MHLGGDCGGPYPFGLVPVKLESDWRRTTYRGLKTRRDGEEGSRIGRAKGVIVMARPAQKLLEDRMLRTYVRGLVHADTVQTRTPSVGPEERTCAHCGQRSVFRLDPDGVWTTCSSCGRYA